MGRPSKFTTAVADTICERIAGGESLRSICRDKSTPAMSSVFRWLAENDSFSEQYARAREAQADTFVDEIVDIADTPMMGEKTKTDKDGNVEITTGDMIEHRRLQIEARKWVAARMRPKKYGDRLDIDQKTTHEAGDSITALMAAIDGRTRTK